MVVIIRRSVIEVKEEQPQKTQVPRAVIVDASVTDISEDQQEKALFCIVVMLDSIKIAKGFEWINGYIICSCDSWIKLYHGHGAGHSFPASTNVDCIIVVILFQHSFNFG